MLRIIANFDQGARSAEEYKYMKSAAGRIYIDLSHLLQHKRFRKIFPLFLQNADALMAAALSELINRPGFVSEIQKQKTSTKNLRKFVRPIIFNVLKNVIYKNPEGTVAFLDNYIEQRVKQAAADINKAAPGTERLKAVLQAASFTPDFKVLLPKLAPALISFKALEKLAQKLLGNRRHVDLIVKGLEGNITTEMGLLVGDLADLVRKSPQLVREFENPDYSTLLVRLKNLEGHAEFKERFESFMAKYDMRAAGEIDMARQRWIESPEQLAVSILAIVKTAQEGAHREEYQETVLRAKEAAAELIREVEAKHGRLKALIVKRLIRVLRNLLPIREHPKYLIMKLILLSKRVFLEEAEALVAKGHLAKAEDVFYVGFWELYHAIEHDESLLSLVEKRKEEYRHYQRLTPPRVLTSEGEEIKAGYHQENLPKGALAGMPVSAGVVEGIARVITDPAKSSLAKGEILVAPFTDPGWTPLFINAAGLVMEVGGLLTHGTVVAREYGIPAVVGITGATNLIKSGQRIRVDGNAGIVMILEEQEIAPGVSS
jgi:phosphohistidine swiveling domain-containing protein